MIPTAKEFKAAVKSLSPEQHRFAQAVRSMQLESTMFGVLVIQIKPQLERVLNLPNDSLTKEIQLTQASTTPTTTIASPRHTHRIITLIASSHSPHHHTHRIVTLIASSHHQGGVGRGGWTVWEVKG